MENWLYIFTLLTALIFRLNMNQHVQLTACCWVLSLERQVVLNGILSGSSSTEAKQSYRLNLCAGKMV